MEGLLEGHEEVGGPAAEHSTVHTVATKDSGLGAREDVGELQCTSVGF